ncbi:MAG TPA: TonB-dependent receptor [Caulobacteraceae bacterium]
MRGRLLAAVSLCALSGAAGAARAAPPDPVADPGATSVQEIVVTAEKRETTLEKTPIAVSAFTTRALAVRTIQDVQGLAEATPGLSYNKNSNFVQLAIRGISLEQINLGGEPGVALYQDGVYLARPYVGDATFFDLARVEVLRGPQGTLYGRNATGGSVNLIGNEPSDVFSGRAGLTLGNYDRVRVEGLVNGPLGDGIDARLGFVVDQHDGYTKNLLDGRRVDNGRTGSGRAAVAFHPTDKIKFVLIADYNREDDSGPVFHTGEIPGTAVALGGRTTGDPRTIYIDGPASDLTTQWGVTGKLTVDLPDAVLTSTSAYRNSSFHLQSDLDGTDFDLVDENLREGASQWSEEVQLASHNDSRFTWIVGAFAFRETGSLNYVFPIPILSTTISFLAHQDTTALAVYGQGTYAITPKLSVTVGLRYSDEDKDGSTHEVVFVPGAVALKGNWAAVTPKFGLQYQATPDNLIYASVGRGFKAGGINTGSLQTKPYNPEYVWSEEVGAKNRFFDGRLQLNLDAFLYQYTDLQVNQFAIGQTFISNAAAATGKGIEADLIAKLGGGFTLDGSLSLLDATFTNYKTADSFRPLLGVIDLKGNQLPLAPRFTASLGLQYNVALSAGDLTVRGDYSHKSDQFFTPFNESYAHAPAEDLFNARISFQTHSGWEVALYGRNLTNQAPIEAITVSGINAGTLVLYGPPRTFGVELRKSF